MDTIQNFILVDDDCIPQRDTEISELSEWFEDATSDADWIESLSVAAESPACSSAEEPTLLEEIYDKNKLLEKQWKESERKYQNLSIENQKLNVQLANEKHKATKYHKKLTYIQDNYHLVNNLKQAYLNMKYNENTERSAIEVKDTSCQTWQGIVCASCIETAELKRQAELAQLCSFVNTATDTITVKRSDLSKLQDTLVQLKQKVDAREESWSYNETKEHMYQETISKLQKTINSLHEIIAKKYSSGETVNNVVDGNSENLLKENVFLRKIIVKLEQRLRDIEKVYKPAERRIPLLNQQEKCIVQQLIKKYAHRVESRNKRILTLDRPTETPTALHPSFQRASETKDTFVAKNGSGEGCSGMIRNPNISQQSNTNEGYKKQAEKPLSSADEINLINFNDDCVYN